MDKAMIGRLFGGGTLVIGTLMFFLGISGKLNSTTEQGDVALIALGGLFSLVGIGMLAFNFLGKKDQ
jgi:hypothetical protein